MRMHIAAARTWLVTGGFVAMLLAGCATSSLRPVTDPTVRYRGTGFSALPPHGQGWYVERTAPSGVLFKKSKGTTEIYNVVAAVLVMEPEVGKVETPEDFPGAVKTLIESSMGKERRFKLVKLETAPYGPKGTYSAGIHLVQEERDNPLAPRAVMEIDVHGFIALDESRKFMIHAYYSERRPQGAEPLINEALKQELEEFLRNVVFTPLR